MKNRVPWEGSACFVFNNPCCVSPVVCSRHRLSEADEEEDLMEEDDLSTKVITRFSHSPWCKH